MKRIISVILAVLLVSALAFTVAVSAEDEFAVSLKLPATYEAGEIIDLTLSLDKIPADTLFVLTNIEFSGIELITEGAVVVTETTGDVKLVLAIIDDEGQLSYTLDATPDEGAPIPAGTTITAKAKVLDGAQKVTVTIDPDSSAAFVGSKEVSPNAAFAQSVLKIDSGIDVDTTDWTLVDGVDKGVWQTATGPVVGTYYYNTSVVDGKAVIEVLFNGKLSGTAKAFGNGNGTNVRVWFHSAKNAAGENQLTYNAFMDVSYNGSAVVSCLRKNTVADGNQHTLLYNYDEEKPYTVESIVSPNGNGLYVKIVLDEIPNTLGEVEAIITVSNVLDGIGNALYSDECIAPYKAWDSAYAVKLGFTSVDEPSDVSSEEPSDDSSEESSAEPSVEPSSEPASSDTGDLGIVAIALLGVIAAAGIVVARKVR